MFIALSFLAMMAVFAQKGGVAGSCALGFGGMYALCNGVVYFAQLGAVRRGLSEGAAALLDFQRFGLFFDLDLFGYGLMALATFFAGLTIAPRCGEERWLKGLLLGHGAFALGCFVLPILGAFGPEMEGGAWIGTALLEGWCLYFAPVGVLCWRYFGRRC
ncbi:hypothetical protein HJY11_02645 [Bittarella massiliensis]|nr:hypothetical protein [Bittarella massiliensis (ex Durand et al. 2017)]